MKRLISYSYLVVLLVMLYAPILIIAIFSFTESKVLGNWTAGSATIMINHVFCVVLNYFMKGKSS